MYIDLNMNRNNFGEIYFYCSPIGFLEIQFKEGQLYSLSQVRSLKSFQSFYDKDLPSVYVPPFWKQKKIRNVSFLKKQLQSLKTQKDVTVEPCIYVFKKKAEKTLPQSIRQLASQLKDYFSGKKMKKWNVSLYSRGTVFQKKVWRDLSRIPYGQTQTYSRTAQKIQSPQAMESCRFCLRTQPLAVGCSLPPCGFAERFRRFCFRVKSENLSSSA